MRASIFLVAAIVLIVFALIAAAQATLVLFGVSWTVWLCASLLAYFVDIATGGWAPWNSAPPA